MNFGGVFCVVIIFYVWIFYVVRLFRYVVIIVFNIVMRNFENISVFGNFLKFFDLLLGFVLLGKTFIFEIVFLYLNWLSMIFKEVILILFFSN